MHTAAKNLVKMGLARLDFSWASRLLCLTTALLIHLFYLSHPIQWFTEQVRHLSAGISEKMPNIQFHDQKMHLSGNMPFELSGKDQLAILFSAWPDSAFLLDKANGSVSVSDSVIYYKTTGKIHVFKDFNWDGKSNWELTPNRWKKLARRYLTVGQYVVHGAAVLALFLSANLLALFGGGIGSIVDGFSDGPFRLRLLMRLSAALLLILSVIGIVCTTLGATFFAYWKIALPLYFMLSFATVDYLIRKIYR